jgi:membrane-anchored mycosin MYCP
MRRSAAVLATTCAIVLMTASPVRAADDPPPMNAGSGCVGRSPVIDPRMPWAVARMGAATLWQFSRGSGVAVAVVDTGVSRSVGALAGAVLPGSDVVSLTSGDSDCQGRGTALASLIAARPEAGSGLVGIAPGAQIVPIKIVDGQGRIPAGALAAGIRAATASGARVVLIGTGAEAPDGDLRAAVTDAVARDVLLIAAVTDQPRRDAAATSALVWYPAAYPEVLAVGGITMDGKPFTQSPAEAGVDLVAPATGVTALGPAGGHYSVGGSTVAAAQVAGVAALLRAYRPTWTQSTVRQWLIDTAEPAPTTVEFAGAFGAGCVDGYAALLALAPGERAAAGPQVVQAAGELVRPPPPDDTAADAARFAGIVIACLVIALAAAAVGLHGRRRSRMPAAESSPAG